MNAREGTEVTLEHGKGYESLRGVETRPHQWGNDGTTLPRGVEWHYVK